MSNEEKTTKALEDNAKALEKVTKALEAQAAATAKLIEQNDKQTKSKEKSNEQLKEEYDWSQKSNEERRREIKYNADLARMQSDQLGLQDQLAKAHKILMESKEQLGIQATAGNTEAQAAIKAEMAAQAELVSSIAKSMGMSEEQTQALIKAEEAIEGVTDSTKRFGKSSDDVFGSIRGHTKFLFGDSKTGLVGGMMEFAASMGGADNKMGGLGKSFIKNFNFANFATAMIGNVIESTIGMITAFDSASTAFAKSTGTGDKFTGMMLEMRQEGNAMGVTFENSAAALKSLAEKQAGFLQSSKSAQKEMATQVALMERVGISTDTSAEMMNVFTINMGKSQKTAIHMTKALSSMGSVLGNSQKFLQNFQESLKTLAVYGDKSVKIFSNLAAAARTAGVEVATLTSIASKFDTFSDAAESVGKLNALLGSQLSSTEMLLMTEDQRIETLIQQVQISGESFAQMDRFKQKAIANAAGITDMNEAQRIFGMDMKGYKKHQKSMERSAKIQDNFNKAIKYTIPLQEKFKQFMAEFAILVKPILEYLGMFIDFLTAGMQKLGGFGKGVLLLVSVLGLLWIAFGSVPVVGASLAAVATGATAVAGAMTGIVTAAGPGGAAMIELGLSASVAAVGMASFAWPLIGIALAIAGVVLSVGYLVGKIAELASIGPNAAYTLSIIALGLWGITSAMPPVIAAIGALGITATGASAGLAAIALPLMGIGLAVSGVALSFGYLVSKIVELASIGPDAVGVLLSFASAMATLSAVGMGGTMAAAGLFMTMGTLVVSLSKIKYVIGEEGSNVSNVLENLALITTGTSAKAMGGVTANIATELKGAVETALTTKIDITLKINDKGLQSVFTEAMVKILDSNQDNRVKEKIIKITGG